MIEKDDGGWHLDKKVPLGLIFAMVVQAGMVVWAVADIKKDVEVLKAINVSQNERDSRQDTYAAEVTRTMQGTLRDISLKLDRLIERRTGKEQE
jgi:hypothetical protein